MTPSLTSTPDSSPPAPSTTGRRLSQSRSFSPTDFTAATMSHDDDHNNVHDHHHTTTTTTTANRKKLSRSKSSDYTSPSTQRRVKTTKSSGSSSSSGSSKLKSLLHDYSRDHAEVPSPNIARKSNTHEEVARKFPKARPTPGVALDMSLLDGSESEHTTTTLDNSGQSVEEMIRFRVRNPNSVAAQPPPPPKLKLSESQLMMGQNHKALHAIVETEGAEEEPTTATVPEESNHSTGSASLAFPPAPSNHSTQGKPEKSISLLGKSPLDDSVASFADSLTGMMDETHPTNNVTTSHHHHHNSSTVTASESGSSSSYMASYRLSEISNVSRRFSDMSMASMTESGSRSGSLLGKRPSDVSELSNASTLISNASTLTEASNAPNNSLLNTTIDPYKRSSTMSALPPLEQMPDEDNMDEEEEDSKESKQRAASVPILSSPHSPKKDSSNNHSNSHSRSSSSTNPHHNTPHQNTPQNNKPTCAHDPTSRLLQAVAKNLEEPIKKPRRPRRNTSGGEHAKKEVEKAMPNLRRTQTSDHNNNDPMGGSCRMRWTRRSKSEDESTEALMDHSGNGNRRATRGGVRRSKSSDGTGGLGRMRRAGRRGDANNGGDEMGESSRRTPLRTKSSDGSIPHMAASSRGRVMRRPSDSKEQAVAKLSSSRGDGERHGKQGFRRSKSSVTSAEAEKVMNSRSLSPGRRANAHKDSNSFGAHHPSMFNSSRIKRFTTDDMDKSSSNFGNDNFSKLMQSHSGGLFVKSFD